MDTVSSDSTTGQVTGFWHAGVTVRDMETSLRFYRDVLGLRVLSSTELDARYAAPMVGLEFDSIRAVFLAVEGSDARIELFEYRGCERHSGSCRPCDYGAGHFCLFVDDVAGVYERLTEAGFSTRTAVVKARNGPGAGAKMFYAVDPDGYHVELYQRRSRNSQEAGPLVAPAEGAL